MPREGSKARLAVQVNAVRTWSELLWTFYIDMLSGGITADHMVVLWTFKQSTGSVVAKSANTKKMQDNMSVGATDTRGAAEARTRRVL